MGSFCIWFSDKEISVFLESFDFFNQKIKPHMFISINIDWMYAREDY